MYILMMVAIRSSETSVHTRATRRHMPEDNILHNHRRESLKYYIIKFSYLVGSRICDLPACSRTTTAVFEVVLSDNGPVALRTAGPPVCAIQLGSGPELEPRVCLH
jgi:hypothetical protein